MKSLRGLVRTVCLLLCLVAASSRTHAADLLAHVEWSLARPTSDAASMQIVQLQGAPGNGAAMRVQILKPSDPFYLTMLTVTVAPSVKDRIRFSFWARSETSNPMRAVVEQNASPWNSIAEINTQLSPMWKRFTVSGDAPDYGPNGMGVRFQFGHKPGTIEIAGVSLVALGPDPAVQTARIAIEPNLVQQRIQKLRMGRVRVEVRHRDGRPVAGIQVHLAQTKHEFLFGCNLFELQTDVGTISQAQQQYRDRFAALFNFATLPFYWGDFQGDREHPKYARLDAMARWCKEHGITAKGHPLVWHEVYPTWAPLTADETIPLLHSRVTDLVTRYLDRIEYWDVVNEANAASNFTNGEAAWVKRDGPSAVVKTVLAWARDATRGTATAPPRFIYNDYNTSSENVTLLSSLQENHALPDCIGLQSHMHNGNWPLERVWSTVNRFAVFHKPIHFTETTVLSGPTRTGVDMAHPPNDWNTTPEDEEVQANYLERFYSVLFSHPSVGAITYWDFSDAGAWQNAPAGLLRRDMTPKPAYLRLLKLIRNRWWTNVYADTDSHGVSVLNGFYGEYDVDAQLGNNGVGQHFSLKSSEKSKTIVLTLP